MIDTYAEAVVSGEAISAMIASIFICFAVPIGLAVFFKLKYRAKFKSAIIGLLAFLSFALVLEGNFNSIIVGAASGSLSGSAYTVFYITYVCLAAGFFEETARFISFRLVLRDDENECPSALMYGVGHGGAEAVLVGFSLISSAMTAVAINYSGFNGALDYLNLSGDQRALIADTMIKLTETSPLDFCVRGVECIISITASCSLSCLVFISAMRKGPAYYYHMAVLLHALFRIPTALQLANVATNVWVSVGIAALECAGIIYLTYRLWNKNGLPGLSSGGRSALLS